MSKKQLAIFSLVVVLLLAAIAVVAWQLWGGSDVDAGEPLTDIVATVQPPLPTVLATQRPPDTGVSGGEIAPTPAPTPQIVGDLENVAASLGLKLDAPPSLTELLEKYPDLADLATNIDLTDEEKLKAAYAKLLDLYEKEGLTGLHEFMISSGVMAALNLDSAYIDFVLAYEDGGLEAAKALARDRRLLTDNEELRVILILDTTDPGEIAALKQELAAYGVVVLNEYENQLEIGIPLAGIEETAVSEDALVQLVQIAHLPHVVGVRAPEFASSDFSQIEGEGPGITGARAWHAAGYTGAGLRVGIIDPGGFANFLGMLGSELPPGDRVFIPDWQDATYLDRHTGEHGTACAEIVHEMAPDASLYLVWAQTNIELGRAVEWLLAQGVDVISYSAGNMFEPIDGSGYSVELTQKALAQDVLWVNSAGNNAETHLYMTFTDSDGNGWHEFPNGDELFAIGTGGVIDVALTWDDAWGGASENYDLYLFEETADGAEEIASSRDFQGGRAADEPVEGLQGSVGVPGTYYLGIRAASITRPGQLNLTGYSNVVEFAYSMPEYSLASPADAPGVMAVGATYWQDDSLESYSSQGPTTDGRRKPDISAPAGVSNLTYAAFGGFSGTSASAPHVAGAAALVRQAYPYASAYEVRDYLMQQALDLGPVGFDTGYGAGRLALPAPPTGTEPPPTGDATAFINDVWVEHNAYVADVLGMSIHVDFNALNQRDRAGLATAAFYDENGAALPDRNGRYASGGQVAVSQDFTPRYDNSRYTDFVLFMPYAEMDLSAGSYTLSFIVTVQDSANTLLAQSAPLPFTLTVSGENRAAADIRNIEVYHNVEGGMGILVDFRALNMQGQEGQIHAYFYFDDGSDRPLQDFNDNYRTPSGKVAVGQLFYPRNNNATYTDFAIYMPYAELHMEPGARYYLKFYLVVWDETGRELTSSNWVKFWYETYN